MTPEIIQAEIENMKKQQREALEFYQQATGAIGALEWALQKVINENVAREPVENND